MEDTTARPPDRVVEQIRVWARDLIDLSKRNRSLYYKPLKRGTLEILSPNPGTFYSRLMDGEELQIFIPPPPKDDVPWSMDELLESAGSQHLVSNRTAGKDVLACLKNLLRAVTADLMDRGVQTMYVCFGMLEWTEDIEGAVEVRSPLVFVPVVLARESVSDNYTLRRSDEDLLLNASLDVLLTEQFGISLGPDEIALQDTDHLAEVFNHVRRQIGAREGWRVSESAVLTRATFHKEAMYRDLLDNIGEIAEHDVIRSLAGELLDEESWSDDFPTEMNVDEQAPPEERPLILDADASQRVTVEAARRGANFVMEGPPGTGKSQTIANIIAQLLADGRSVLFVSEKAAALEVVARRLAERELQDFLLELHSHKSSRKEVVSELYNALSTRPKARTRMSQADRTRAQRTREELSAYAKAVNSERQPLGRSVAWVVGRLTQLADARPIPAPSGVDGTLAAHKVAELLEQFESLSRVWAPVEDPDFAWRGIVGTRITTTDEQLLGQKVGDLIDRLNDLQRAGEELAYNLGMPDPTSVVYCKTLIALADHAASQPVTEVGWWTESLERLTRRLETLRSWTEQQRKDEAYLTGIYGSRWVELPQNGAEDLDRATALLGGLMPPIRIPETPTPTGLGAARATIVNLRTDLADMRPDLEAVARALGVPNRPRTIDELIDLAEIANWANESTKPHSSWFNANVSNQVQAAVEQLGPALDEFHKRHEVVEKTFTEKIYELDLPTLQARIRDARGLAKLGSVYRAAKNEIAAASRIGKARKSVLETLPSAVEAQRARRHLDALEAEHAELLGHHYRKRSTDCRVIERAVGILEDAIEALGVEYNADAVSSVLAGDVPAEDGVGQKASRVKNRLEAALESVRNAVPGSPHLANLQVDDALAWAAESQDLLEVLSGILTSVKRLRGETASLSLLSADLNRRSAVLRREQEVERSRQTDSVLLGERYAGFDTPWDELAKAVSWIEELHAILNGPAPDSVAAKLSGADVIPSGRELADHLESWDETFAELLDRFSDEEKEIRRRQLSGNFESVKDALGLMQDRVGDARTWLEYAEVSRELEEAGWHASLAACRHQQAPANDVPATLERAMYAAWFEAVLASDDRLKRYRSADRDSSVDDFRKLDKALIDDASEWVVTSCNVRRPKVSGVGAANTIEREANKKRRHMPVRLLLERTVELATALKPCFMMSPLSVSQFLPAKHRFDVVIFDEASQIRPADAINCIYRGSQLIVAGDDRQLPPTSFFDVTVGEEDDSYEEEAFEEFESILGLCNGTEIMRSFPLRWHYRSQHESLITFSNYQFYQGKLITYPCSVEKDADLGVEHFLVDGTYRRGGPRDNPTEARFVAERVLRHARDRPELSVGVVALSSAQAGAIEDAVEDLRRNHPEMDGYFEESRLDGFFVKNLETVQGDERDIILLSIGYGPDEAGRFTMNFGPVNRAGGWRRLNVAVTRARRRVELVTSFRAEDMRTQDSRSEGLAALQRYIDYAQRGIPALAVDLSQSEGDVESPLEESILSVLRSWGYEVVPQLGAAGYRLDMAIRDPKNPGRFLLGVEADGAAYHSSRAARDRDRLRQQVLERLGWKLHRIWGPSWYRDRDAEMARLRQVIERAQDRGKSDMFRPDTESTPMVRRSAERVDLDGMPEWATTYQQCRLWDLAVGRAHDPRNRLNLQKAVIEVIETESPVHVEVIGRRVADHWGHNLTQKTRLAVADIVRPLVRNRQEISCRGEFVWRGDDFEVRVPSDKDNRFRREIQHIPPEEVKEAVNRLLIDAHSSDEEELLHAVKGLFGFDRMGAKIHEALDTALETLLQEGAITRGDDGRLRPLQD